LRTKEKGGEEEERKKEKDKKGKEEEETKGKEKKSKKVAMAVKRGALWHHCCEFQVHPTLPRTCSVRQFGRFTKLLRSLG
jgi:hypothetical protein